MFFTVSSALADHQHAPAPAATAPPPLFDDVGTLQHSITTTSPQAQQYFNQGLRFVYAFNHDEATRAFKEAARLDPNCAMAYWGIALTLGPNYNLPVDAERDRAAYEALQKALELSSKSQPESEHISKRWRSGTRAPDADRKALDNAYADAMREVARRYPDDLDAATLFAEALMNLHPWDLWTLDGQPQPGLRDRRHLESVLQRNPIIPAPSTTTFIPSKPRHSRNARSLC